MGVWVKIHVVDKYISNVMRFSLEIKIQNICLVGPPVRKPSIY